MLRDTLLIIDDSELDLAILNEIFKRVFRVQCFQDAHQALSFLKANADRICAALLDICLGRRGAGFTLLQQKQSDPTVRDLPVILITSDASREYVIRGVETGAADFLVKPVDPHTAQDRVCSTVRAAWPAGSTILDGRPKEPTTEHLEGAPPDGKDPAWLAALLTGGVSLLCRSRGLPVASGPGVQRLAALLAESWHALFPDSGFSGEQAAWIAQAAALCDVGLLGLPEAAARSGPEDPQYLRHTELGRDFFAGAGIPHPFLLLCADVAGWHHKNYDGTGYPPTETPVPVPIGAQLVHAAFRCDLYIRKYRSNPDCCDRVLRALAAEEGHLLAPEMCRAAEAAHDQLDKVISECY